MASADKSPLAEFVDDAVVGDRLAYQSNLLQIAVCLRRTSPTSPILLTTR